MNRFTRILALAAVAVSATVIASMAEADDSIDVGAEPDCPYGYYDTAPYECAAYGYYGPEWFDGGVFIGIGPWFHGPDHFHGHVNNHFDAHRGYKGPLPNRGDRRNPAMHPDHNAHFRGNEMRDASGHAGGGRR